MIYLQVFILYEFVFIAIHIVFQYICLTKFIQTNHIINPPFKYISNCFFIIRFQQKKKNQNRNCIIHGAFFSRSPLYAAFFENNL